MRHSLASSGLPLVALLSLLGLGCSTQDQYLVAATELAAPRPTAPSRAAVVPAQRLSDGRAVFLPRPTLDLASLRPAPPNHPQPEAHRIVRARAYSPALTAGATLTWVGTAVSLIGSGLFLAGRVRGDNGLFLAGSFTALAAEPVMWAGIVYWLAATLRPAQEVTAPPPNPDSPR